MFAIILKETNEFIGEIGLHFDRSNRAQLGYWVGQPLWNKGIVSEAVAAVLEFAFGKLALDQVYATCHTDNGASGRVVEKNGMKQSGIAGNVATYVLSKSEHELLILAP